MITTTNPQTFSTTASSHRAAGRAAIASGVTGIMAIGCLASFLILRGSHWDAGVMMLRFHDVGVIIQFLLLVPVVFGLRKVLRQRSTAMSGIILNTRVWALYFTAILLLLGIVKFVSDGLYSVAQGVFGVWLIVVGWRMKGVLSAGLRWFGMVVGLGLALVGSFCIAYAIFVSTLILKIPAATIEEIQKIPYTPANNFLHYIIFVGSAMGVLTLPFWTLLLGRKLLRG